MNRKPPRPKTWDSPKGYCRFCGEIIIEHDKQNLRKNWHKLCLERYYIQTRPMVARKFVWNRDKGVCQNCGKASWTYGETWEVDHIKRLAESNGDVSFWEETNMQLLCTPCHRSKTSKENKKLDTISSI